MGPQSTFLRFLLKSQWWDAEQLEKFQLAHLKSTVDYARKNVPWYKTGNKGSLPSPGDFSRLEDFTLYPLTLKKDVFGQSRLFYSRSAANLFARTAYTGGTTGTPIMLRRNFLSIGIEHAFLRRQWLWAGITGADRCAYLTGRILLPPDAEKGPFFDYDPIMKELTLSTYHLTPERSKDYLKAMQTYKVTALAAYPSAAYALARANMENGSKVSLRAVLTSSETLHDEMKSLISKSFGCAVYDYYGSAERVCSIHTCEEGNYHVLPEYGFTELSPLDSDGKCRIVSTGFWNRAMPLIRYDLGDIIVPSKKKCPCGRNFPLVDRIAGRPVEKLVTPSGKELGSALLTHVLYGAKNIRESQILQDSADHCFINFVPAAGFSKPDELELARIAAKYIPSEIRVETSRVESIPRTASGKFRPLVGLSAYEES